jgi:hypothetical protein
VAWLERRYQETGNVCYLPDEVDVRDVMLLAADRNTWGGVFRLSSSGTESTKGTDTSVDTSVDSSSSGSSGSRGVLEVLRRKLGPA